MKRLPFDEYFQLPLMGYSQPPPQEERKVTLRDYWKVIQKRRWTIIAFLLIVVITTAVGTFTMRPIYRGTATIQINKENPQIVDFKEIFAVNTMDRDYYQTQYKLLESRKLARRIIHLLKLSQHPEFLPRPESNFQRWRSNMFAFFLGFFTRSNKDASRKGRETFLIDTLLEKVKIEPIRSTRLVKIHFDSYSPELSAKVCNT
ncbi:MAG: hypothetical protein JSW70_03350, partial [Syntrophobacterales bacterium]